MYPKIVQKLIDLFSKFPGVGPRTAARFVFYLLEQKNSDIEDLSKAISQLKKALRICQFCFKWFDPSFAKASEGKWLLCEICSDRTRNRNLLCIIEKQTDLVSIENNKIYKGLYFILGGTVNSLKKQALEKLRLNGLVQRIQNPEKFGISNADFQEIIIATNPTVEGEATALLLERKLKPLNKKITRLGRGLPTGGELEYADKETMLSAFKGRK